MSFRPIQEGQPLSPNTLNRYLANSSHVWKATTSFSGTNAYNFLNVIDNSTATPTNPAFFTRVVISTVLAASNTVLFIRLIDTAGTVVATNNYWIGYYGIDSGGTARANGAAPTSVFNVGDMGTYPASWTLDFFHLTGTGTQMTGYGATGISSAAQWPAWVQAGGFCNYTALPISGLQLLSFAAVNFSGKLSVYQQRRIT